MGRHTGRIDSRTNIDFRLLTSNNEEPDVFLSRIELPVCRKGENELRAEITLSDFLS